jgi:hypothetical protein
MHRPPSHKKRGATRLSGSLERKLIGYAAAASAAGVGVLASSLPAAGRVVSTVSWTQISPNANVSLDLNNDGLPDFQFSNRFTRTSYGRFTYGTLQVSPQSQGNAIWGAGGSASALGSGVRIGPNNGKFQAGHDFMGKQKYHSTSSQRYSSTGQWTQQTGRYLGFKFSIQGEIHYGWARLNVAATNNGMYDAVTKYAYETVPNKPIVTGRGGGVEESGPRRRRTRPGSVKPTPALPGSLGSLAAGAAGWSARQKLDAGRE